MNHLKKLICYFLGHKINWIRTEVEYGEGTYFSTDYKCKRCLEEMEIFIDDDIKIMPIDPNKATTVYFRAK